MNLTEIRKSKSIRMTDLANQLGISQGHFSNLERGKRPLNDNLINKIADILGEPATLIKQSINSSEPKSLKLGSWISNIRIYGLPFVKAFRYYIENNNLQAQVGDETVLRNTLKHFIETNIGYSVVAELSENKAVLNHIREHIGMEETPKSQKDNINEQSTGQ
ncbi:MAG: helix-turn-helix transcriptional regulator [Bacteroidota bacterium]